jgi:hypothetical protein
MSSTLLTRDSLASIVRVATGIAAALAAVGCASEAPSLSSYGYLRDPAPSREPGAPEGDAAPAGPRLQDGSQPSGVQSMFFENSVRRDATAAEASRVANVGGCTAFFLENTAGKVYLASARHCFQFAITNWCTTNGQVTDNSGNKGKCTKVVAADTSRDVAVFEADIKHASTGDSTLRLSAYVPSLNSALVMVGYPGDNDPTTGRNGKLTTTEKCWVLSGSVQSPYANQDKNTLDLSAMHNCTTYGGNSGGPMYREGTRDAVGLPFTYVPDDYKRRSPTDTGTAAHMALTSDFVSAHQAELTAAGIVIASTQAGGTVGGGAGTGAGGNAGTGGNAGNAGAGGTGGSGAGTAAAACTCGVDGTGYYCGLFRGTAVVAYSYRTSDDPTCAGACASAEYAAVAAQQCR